MSVFSARSLVTVLALSLLAVVACENETGGDTELPIDDPVFPVADTLHPPVDGGTPGADGDDDGPTAQPECPPGVTMGAELCDGLDNDCDGLLDEGYADTDVDGQADCIDPDLDGDGVPNDLDCAPTNPDVWPGAVEVCDGLDNDCSGVADNVSCEDGNPCTSGVCAGAQGCQYTPVASGCNDANPCTENDTCSFGVCSGTFIDCEDGNGCTTDSCNPETGCQHEYVAAPCDDGNPCTIGDQCQDGVCQGTPSGCDCESVEDCDDGNPCTTEVCDQVTGCNYIYNNTPCNDGNACSTGDLCSNGVCLGTSSIPCGDGNDCTSDTCDPLAGCVHTPITAPCNDGSACTSGDSCVGGICQGETLLDCDDVNPCTLDTCDPSTGCQYTYSVAPCDDANPCTLGDQCSGGVCQGGGALPCDDFNPCTDDLCDPVQGCQHSYNTNPCNDGNACTMGDVCGLGTCTGQAITCDDTNPCTSDACDLLTGCSHVAVGGPCTDGNACTLGDSCLGGTCVAGDGLTCDDGNVCTVDSCNSQTGCNSQPLNAVPCDDGNACTQTDTCQNGLCVGQGNEGCCSTDLDCDDGNGCTKDTCNVQTGQCSSAAATMNGIACNADSNGCTSNDTCFNGSCLVGVPVDCSAAANDCNTSICQNTGTQSYFCALQPKGAGSACDDGQYCTVGEACTASGVCEGGQALDCSGVGGGCISGTCDEATNSCVGDSLPNGTACNADNNGCTVGDSCQSGSCIAGPAADCSWQSSECIIGLCAPEGAINPAGYACNAEFKPLGTPCEDDLFCTSGDTCDGAGWCASGGPNPCSAVATDCATGECDESQDVCTPLAVANGQSCQDGDSCTTGDMCLDGLCTGSDNVCGEFKVSTFETAMDGYWPALADKGAGSFNVFWQDDSGDHVNGRSYTNSWSKEWSEYILDTGGDDDLSVDADGNGDGVTVVARTHRVLTFSQNTTCCYDYGSCDNGSCSSCSGCGCSYKKNKYYGSKHREERIYLHWVGAQNQVTKTVTVFDRTDNSSWSNQCSSKSGYSYASNFGSVRVAVAPSGAAWVMWRDGSAVKSKLYDAAGALIKDFGTLGTGWTGHDVSAHADDTFVITWSSADGVSAQLYTPSGESDGSEIGISTAGSATLSEPSLDTYTNGRFVVAWRQQLDGVESIITRVFKKEGSPAGPIEIQANTTASSQVSRPSVGAYDTGGSFVVVWQAMDSDWNIRAQYFTKNAEPIGDEKLVNVTVTGHQQWPLVKVLGSDEGVVTWRGSDGHVRARKYDNEGEALTRSEEIIHNETVDYGQSAPTADELAGTGYVVAWERGTADNDLDVVFRRFGADGLALGTEILVHDTTAGWQTHPSVAAAGNGSFAAVWESYGQDGDQEGVYARRFGVDGTALTGEIAVNEYTDYEQFEPVIAVDQSLGSDGNFMVAWSSFDQPDGSGYDVIARCFAASGQAMTSEFLVNATADSDSVANDQQAAAVAWIPEGPSRYIVVWASKNQDGDNWGIYARRITPGCQVQGLPFQVNTTTANVQSQPAVAASSTGAFVVAWRSLNEDGDNYGIYAQHFNNSGTPVGDQFLVNPVTANQQSAPALRFMSDDSLVAGWTTLGEDEDSWAVKLQHFDINLAPTALDFLGNIYYDSEQDQPLIVPQPDGGYVGLWVSNEQDGDGGTIVGRILP